MFSRLCPSRAARTTIPVVNSIARTRFQTAVRRVVQLLKLRKQWAAFGRVLQQKPRTFLWEGLERRKGKLIRKSPAISVWNGKS